MTEGQDPATGSKRTVLLALSVNLAVGILKLAAGLISGSGALLSESAHSVGDTSTELLLVTALRRSARPPDRVHPFGYGKDRYFWSLLAAVAIFMSGAAFSTYEGLHTLLNGGPPTDRLWINYPVLGIAFVLEGASFRQALHQTRGEARQRRRSVRAVLRDPQDPTVRSVVLEDSAALIGIVVATLGVALHQLTGAAMWDGLASLAIGVLLVVAAFLLARTCEALLIGKQADTRVLREIEARLQEQPEVDDVVDLLTMMTGVGRILLCARVDFIDDLIAQDLERACVRIDTALRREFPELDEIFIQPVPKADRGMHDRVTARYGHALTEPGPS